MDWFLVITASVFMVLGIIGCFLPVMPGPSFNYIGILLLHFTNWVEIPSNTLVYWFIATLAIVVADYYLPAYAVKRFGASKIGYYFSILGIIVGLLFFGIIGAIIAPFLGALIGEIISGKSFDNAIKPALGSFIGIISGIFLKLAISIYFTIKFIILLLEVL